MIDLLAFGALCFWCGWALRGIWIESEDLGRDAERLAREVPAEDPTIHGT